MDPHWFNAYADPDLAFFPIAYPNSFPDPVPDPDPVLDKGFDDHKYKKKLQLENFLFWIKNGNLLFPSPPLKTHKLQEKLTKVNIQHFKKNKSSLLFFFICGTFLPPWIWIKIRIFKMMIRMRIQQLQ